MRCTREQGMMHGWRRLGDQQTRDHIAGTTTVSRIKRGELELWQRRFWEHQIRDLGDFERHVNYIHWNPVKHGYVKRVLDWPYSSFHRYLQRGDYPVDWAGSVGKDNHKQQYVEPARSCAQRTLRTLCLTGR